MFETLSRSADIVKKSFQVLLSEKKLLLFPAISGLALIALIISFIFPIIFISESEDLSTALTLLFYFLAYFLIIFFNSALIHAASNKIDGKNVAIGESISFALSKIVNIIIWSAIAATVGVILSILRGNADKQRGVGAIVGAIVISIIGMAWSFATFFVVPVIIFENLSPFAAIKKSIELIKKSWGESIAGGFGISAVFFILYLLGIGLGVLLFLSKAGFGLTLGLIIPYFILVFLAQNTLDGIFVAALYKFATTGKTTIFSNEELQGAFKKA